MSETAGIAASLAAHDARLKLARERRDALILTRLGLNLVRLRNEAGLSQTDLAGRVKLHRTYLSGIERGVRNPGIETVLRLARTLRVSVDVKLTLEPV